MINKKNQKAEDLLDRLDIYEHEALACGWRTNSAWGLPTEAMKSYREKNARHYKALTGIDPKERQSIRAELSKILNTRFARLEVGESI